MASLARSRATLRLIGDDLQPQDITARLGAEPTSAHVRGDRNEGRPAPAVWRTGSWRLSADDAEPADPATQVMQILDQLTPDLAVWQSLGARYRIDLFCGWFMDEHNEGAHLPAAVLRALGERGIALDLDIYGATGDAGDDD